MMTIIDNGCTKVGLENWMQEILTGGIIVAAVALDKLRHRTGS
jgi:ABC-type glucose/galactose transport system permease subunit